MHLSLSEELLISWILFGFFSCALLLIFSNGVLDEGACLSLKKKCTKLKQTAGVCKINKMPNLKTSFLSRPFSALSRHLSHCHTLTPQSRPNINQVKGRTWGFPFQPIMESQGGLWQWLFLSSSSSPSTISTVYWTLAPNWRPRWKRTLLDLLFEIATWVLSYSHIHGLKKSPQIHTNDIYCFCSIQVDVFSKQSLPLAFFLLINCPWPPLWQRQTAEVSRESFSSGLLPCRNSTAKSNGRKQWNLPLCSFESPNGKSLKQRGGIHYLKVTWPPLYFLNGSKGQRLQVIFTEASRTSSLIHHH